MTETPRYPAPTTAAGPPAAGGDGGGTRCPADPPAPASAADVPDIGTARDNGPDTGPVAIAEERSDLRGVLLRAERAGELPCPHCDEPSPARPDLSCPSCGTRRPVARDHVEMTVGVMAGITDRGRRRRRNEDAVALGRRATPAGELLVGVVCDGVASARRGDEASLEAVEAAVDAALDAADRDSTGPAPPAAAARAAAELGFGGDGVDPPACTYVGVAVRTGSAVVSWVGDSRVYWLAGDGSSQLLTTDDSWAEEIAAAGLIPRDQVLTDRRAHVLTRWLGRDSPQGPARSRRVRVTVPGLLVLCSDGMWNHVPEAEELAGLVAGRDALDDAAALVSAALAAGGHDNVTVAVLPVAPADPAEEGLEIDGRGPDETTGPIPILGGPA